jgi:hypothetical protein
VLGFGIVQLTCGIGLLKLKRYGRFLLRSLSIVGLLAFPVGTIISIVILIYLNTPGIKLLFSERPVQDLTVVEYAQLVAASESSTAATVVVIIGVLGVGVVSIGIVAAIAVPGLLRARVASNEAAAIGTLRTFAAAELAYASVNNGRYGSPECLMAPAKCIPGYSGSPFLASPMGRAFQSRGYVFQFFSTETTDPQNVLAEPARAIKSFAVLALPMTVRSTGHRSFCIDASNRLTWTVTLNPPSVLLAACPEWNDLSSSK